MVLEWLFSPIYQPRKTEERHIEKPKKAPIKYEMPPISTAPPPELDAVMACMSKTQDKLSRVLDDTSEKLDPEDLLVKELDDFTGKDPKVE